MSYTVPLFESDVLVTSNNPEIILMLAEGDEAECDVEESMWLAGTFVTHLPSGDYE